MKKLLFLSLIVISFIFTSCTDIRNVKPGYVAELLTPTGYSGKLISAGQVDIGELNSDNAGNSLITMEVTTKTVKESFYKAEKEGEEDHRVRTSDGTPLAVDIYIQISVPETKEGQLAAIQSITPIASKDEDRVYIVSLEDIYSQFAQMIIRGKVREIFAKYPSADEVMKNYEKINNEINLMVINVFEKSKTPVALINTQLSNVKEDESVLKSKNKILEAQNESDAIEKVGQKLRQYPEYLELQKIKTYSEAAAKAASVSFIISDSKGASPVYSVK